MAMNAQGIELSPWINRAMALYLGVPEDPKDELIKKKTDIVVSTLLLRYESEVRERIKDNAQKCSIEDAKKAKEDQLIQFGISLKKLPGYSSFLKCLDRKDYDDGTLEKITQSFNNKNGSQYDKNEFWNQSITWYQKYGMVQ